MIINYKRKTKRKKYVCRLTFIYTYSNEVIVTLRKISINNFAPMNSPAGPSPSQLS